MPRSNTGELTRALRLAMVALRMSSISMSRNEAVGFEPVGSALEVLCLIEAFIIVWRALKKMRRSGELVQTRASSSKECK